MRAASCALVALLAGCCNGNFSGGVYTGKPPAPLQGAEVVVYVNKAEQLRVTTGDDGLFELKVPCRSDRYQVGVFPPGAETAAVVDSIRLVGDGAVKRNYALNNR